MTLLITSLYIVFTLGAVALVVVILLQEGKGGGLTSALGASGQQAFGVGASGINKFTGWTGAILLVSALSIHYCNRIDANHGVPVQFAPEQVHPATGGGSPGSTPVESPK
jgi:preprotein translocase subunit SecG